MNEIKRGTNKFYIGENEQNDIARITWLNEGDDVIIVNHTFVDPELRGQSIAGKLLDKVVKMAREENLKVVPTCSYAVAKLTRTDEYKDILK
jgi:predicted GNAT family acetyltransferase